jgi:uncharacterized membrane protein
MGCCYHRAHHSLRRPFGQDQTVNIKMSYNPPAGAIGLSLAALFGSDPKALMDDDLVRMKTMIETGKAPHDAAARAVS